MSSGGSFEKGIRMEKSTCVDFEMNNGTVQLTLNFYRLNQLKTKHKEEYKRYFDLAKDGMITDLDGLEMIYIAYLCANIEKMPDVMTWEEFLQNAKNGRARIWRTIQELQTDEKN